MELGREYHEAEDKHEHAVDDAFIKDIKSLLEDVLWDYELRIRKY